MNTQIGLFNGYEIEYVLKYHESEKKPLLIFLNGAGRNLTDWESIISALDSNISYLCFNRPGVGKSSEATMPQAADTNITLLNTMLCKLFSNSKIPLVFITHSIGSLIAQLGFKNNKFSVLGALLIEPTTNKDVAYVFKKELYISQNTFSESDNVQTSINQIVPFDFNCSKLSIIVGTKLYFTEFINPFSYRRKHIKYIKEFAKYNNARIVYANNSRHFPMVDDLNLVNSELQFIMNSISQLP